MAEEDDVLIVQEMKICYVVSDLHSRDCAVVHIDDEYFTSRRACGDESAPRSQRSALAAQVQPHVGFLRMNPEVLIRDSRGKSIREDVNPVDSTASSIR